MGFFWVVFTFDLTLFSNASQLIGIRARMANVATTTIVTSGGRITC
jgi:hypothetical protein